MPKQLFVAATRQNDGKTMVSLGLFHAFQKRFSKTAYMKPVGQQYRVIDGKKIDKDAVLISTIYHLQDNLQDMSPIAVPRGFTTEYIESGNRDKLVSKLMTSQESLAKNNDFILYEGTGHAGVGSVFDMSNAAVAKLVGSKVVLVGIGGIGSSIDELMLNKASFDQQGVDVIGVIINKVREEKYDKISGLVRKALARHNLPVFGVIPLVNMLSWPSILELKEDLNAELLSSGDGLLNTAEKFVIGDMPPHDALSTFSKNTVLIVPGNHEGLILAALFGNVSGIIFTNGRRPDAKVMDLVLKAQIPVLLVKEDSFTLAATINQIGRASCRERVYVLV